MMFAFLMVVLTLVLGRFFCGWVCPLGTIIDICGSIRKKRRDFGESKNKIIRSPKFYILSIIVIFSFLGMQVAWIFDPMVITARFVSLNLIPGVTSILDKVLVYFITRSDFYTPLYDFYRSLKSSVLGIHVYYFSHSGVILAFFVVICALTLLARRLWCRAFCPLGALYSLIARFSFLSRRVDKCINCARCRSDCRMAAIRDDISYIKGECILCMDCIYDCPVNGTRFGWGAPKADKNKTDLSRRSFLFLMAASFLSMGFGNRRGRRGEKDAGDVIRPPAALKEDDFLDRCVRCGNCMKVCITNGLQPVIFETGLEGIWTPRLVPEIGYCEYQCTLCGNVCPTGAIPSLTLAKKKKIRLGLAEIDRSICIAWAENKECIVCEEHCPVADKAIKLTGLRPYVDHRLCVGCGICQNKCPTRPVRAIKVSPRKSYRT
jgi:ferredoxin